MECKLVLGDPKTGKCYQREVKDDAAKAFVGLKIGDKIRGELFDLTGYEFEITGGSDHCGFPMRRDLDGSARKKILSVQGVGVTRREKGIRYKKTIAGNTIHDKTAQVNLKILKHGTQKLAPEKEEAPAEAAKEEKPAEKAPEAKAEKPAEKKTDAKK